MSLNHQESSEMAAMARHHGRFLMEALWSRFLPAYRMLDAIVRRGDIGEVLCVEGSLGFRAPIEPHHRLFARQLGGGALLDVGIYPVHLAHLLLGPPVAVAATSRLGDTGVDEDIVVTMRHASGALSIAHASIRSALACTARVTGSEGCVELPAAMQCPQHLDVVHFDDRGRRRIETPHGTAPFRFEIEEVHRCLENGQMESSLMPLSDTLAIAATLDRARAEIGLIYPNEDPPDAVAS
jgi:predicted dehydrogenase